MFEHDKQIRVWFFFRDLVWFPSNGVLRCDLQKQERGRERD